MPLQDARLPYLETALNRRAIRELVSEHVLPALFPGRTLTKLAMQYSRYKAGREHVALYQVELDPPLENEAPLLTVTFGQRGRLQRVHEQIRASGGGRKRSVFYLMEQPCLIEIFPSDWCLPLLWQAADADRAGDLIAHMLPDYTNVRVKRVDVLRYRPGRRCVLRYAVEHGQGTIDLVAKLYTNRDRAQLVADKLAVLCSQPTSDIKLAAPIGKTSNDGLLLMECLDGSNLGDHLENATSPDNNERAIRTAAAGLAAFHRFQLKSSERRSLQTELNNLRSRLAPIHNVAPDLARRIETLLIQVEARIGELAPAADCVIHGEYKPNQLLLADGKLAVVDLDRACIGDPAIDVGNFVAVLQKEVIYEGHAHLAGLGDVFLAAYQAANSVNGIVQRVRIFQTLTFLRMLTRYYERNPQNYARLGAEWPPLIFLDEARRSIDLP